MMEGCVRLEWANLRFIRKRSFSFRGRVVLGANYAEHNPEQVAGHGGPMPNC